MTVKALQDLRAELEAARVADDPARLSRVCHELRGFYDALDVHRALEGADGLEHWRQRMHARCDPLRGIRCPRCS